MYASGYSQVSKQSQRKMQYHSKGKSCGYYMRIVFFFSSLIQSLIIVSLVLFLIYGKDQDLASTTRIQDLEESFSRLSLENAELKKQRKNLTNLLNTTLTEKARNDWDLARLRFIANISASIIVELEKKMQECHSELTMWIAKATINGNCPTMSSGSCNCEKFVEHLRARLQLVESNFTQTTQRLSRENDENAKERDNLHLQAINLRREKFMREKEAEICRQQCKTDFADSLSGISNVTRAFLAKVDSLFPMHMAFQLTCSKQRDHLEQIRSNCTSLSREVEDKFQRYLNNVGEQVSAIQEENIRLKAENWRLSMDYRSCSQNRTAVILQNKQNLENLQQKHDENMKKQLLNKRNLEGDIVLLNNTVNYKSKEVEHLKEQLKHLDMSCKSKVLADLGRLPGGSRTSSSSGSSSNSWNSGSSSSSSSSSSLSQIGRSGSNFGSSGSTFNNPGSTGTGSSFLSTGSGSSTGTGFNKPSSTGTGSSSSSFLSTGSGSSTGTGFNKPSSTGTGSSSTSLFAGGSGSSTGLGLNKLSSTGTGSSSTSLLAGGSGSSTGSGLNKPISTGGFFGSASSSSSLGSSGTGSNRSTMTGRSSSPTGSSFGSTGSSSSLGSSGTSSNKPTTNTKSSTGSTSSSGSSVSTSRFASWFGGSSSSQSKSGSDKAKGPSPGNSYGGKFNVAQHLQDLQRLINPSGPEEKQDLSRMIG